MDNIYTEDLAEFGTRELNMAGELLSAIKNGLPEDFWNEGLKVGFNKNSGYVFLTNSDYQVCMIDDKGKLYSYYSTPHDGLEGSFEELMEDLEEMHEEDKEFMQDLKQYHPEYEEANNE